MSTMTQDFLAGVGEKVTDIPVTIRYAKFNRAMSWNRSNTMFIIAETEGGQTIKISGSSASLFGLQRGDQVTIASAKVKAHGEYRGTPQTILWHVKIEPFESGEELAEERAQSAYEEIIMENATTTLAKFAGTNRRNYETLPTIDVEILPDVHHCRECGGEIVWKKDSPMSFGGAWGHVDVADSEKHHAGGWIGPKTRCRYCHSEEHATYRQLAWHDAVECTRCGGHDGHAIGD